MQLERRSCAAAATAAAALIPGPLAMSLGRATGIDSHALLCSLPRVLLSQDSVALCLTAQSLLVQSLLLRAFVPSEQFRVLPGHLRLGLIEL